MDLCAPPPCAHSFRTFQTTAICLPWPCGVPGRTPPLPPSLLRLLLPPSMLPRSAAHTRTCRHLPAFIHVWLQATQNPNPNARRDGEHPRRRRHVFCIPFWPRIRSRPAAAPLRALTAGAWTSPADTPRFSFLLTWSPRYITRRRCSGWIQYRWVSLCGARGVVVVESGGYARRCLGAAVALIVCMYTTGTGAAVWGVDVWKNSGESQVRPCCTGSHPFSAT